MLPELNVGGRLRVQLNVSLSESTHFALPSRRGANLAKEALKVICTPKARQPFRKASNRRPRDVSRKILILLDSPKVRGEVTTYSVELARRMGARLYLLMLLRWESSLRDGPSSPTARTDRDTVCEQGELVLKACLDEIQGFGVEAVGAVRQGDPSSELLKFLAENEPFQAVVWGGNEAFLRRRRTPVRTHWLERIREQLDCTLVVPSLKSKESGVG
jgi:hypothetical protein